MQELSLGAQRLFLRSARVHGLGEIFWPPMFSLIALCIEIKALLLLRVATENHPQSGIDLALLQLASVSMGNSFGFLRTVSGSPFQFAVVEVCQAENINLTQACNLTFNANHELFSIGNVTRGTMEPQPGIAGIGVS
jgi:hypothetical protein